RLGSARGARGLALGGEARADLPVGAALLPPGEPCGLALHEVSLHREVGLRQIQRVAKARHLVLRKNENAPADRLGWGDGVAVPPNFASRLAARASRPA